VTDECIPDSFANWALPVTEGCPIPCLQAVREICGRVDCLKLLLWKHIKAGRAYQLPSETGGELKVTPEDVAIFEDGIVRWSSNQDGYNDKYSSKTCRYVGLHAIPKTATEYLQMTGLALPTEAQPDVFGNMVWVSLAGRLTGQKPDETQERNWNSWGAKARYLCQLPPGATDGSWYPVVRVEYSVNGPIRRMFPNIESGLFCIEQLGPDDHAASSGVHGWPFRGFQIAPDPSIQSALDFLTKLSRERPAATIF